MVLVAYRHGLRVSELVDLRWEQVDFKTATLHVRRVKKGTLAPIRSLGTNYVPCGGSSASKSLSRPSCSPQSGARRSRRPVSPAWSSEQARKRSLGLRRTRTCSGMPAATRSPIRVTIRAPYKPTLDTATFSTPLGTLSCRRRGLRIFGGSRERKWRQPQMIG